VKERATVVFDGRCSVCSALKDHGERLDTKERLRWMPFQTADLGALSEGLTQEMASRSVYLVDADGKRYRGARAVFEAMKRLPGAWGVVGRVGAFPPFSLLAEPVYRLVARNRDRISRRFGLERTELEE
jgi:predicted DCC family thiol-disulfide oxidoreductase YuxK